MGSQSSFMSVLKVTDEGDAIKHSVRYVAISKLFNLVNSAAENKIMCFSTDLPFDVSLP